MQKNQFNYEEVNRIMKVLEMDDLYEAEELRNMLLNGNYYEVLKFILENGLTREERIPTYENIDTFRGAL